MERIYCRADKLVGVVAALKLILVSLAMLALMYTSVFAQLLPRVVYSNEGDIIAAPGWENVSIDNVLGDMDGSMSNIATLAGKYAKDLPKQTFSGGLCSTFGDNLWRLVEAPFKACINPALTKVMGDCTTAVEFDSSKPAETLAAVSACGRQLAGYSEGNFASNMASAVGNKIIGSGPQKVILNSLSCMTNTLIYAADIPDADRKEALAATSALDTFGDLYALGEIADKIVENGRGAIPDFFKHDISGHDGNSSSISVMDWAAEAHKISEDPLKYARERTAGEFKNTTTELLADAALNSDKTVERLEALAHPEAWRRSSEQLKDECAFSQADAIWSLRRADLERDLQNARDKMDFYAHRTACSMIKNNFDGLSNPVWRAELLLNPKTTTPFKNWTAEIGEYEALAVQYQTFRTDLEAFEKRSKTRKDSLGSLFSDITLLETNSRASARFCNQAGGTPPEFANSVLSQQLEQLSNTAKAASCSADATKIHLAAASSMVESPQVVWEAFSRKVAAQINGGALCEPSQVASMRSELDEIGLASFGTTDIAVLKQCAFPIDLATWLPDLLNGEKTKNSLGAVMAQLGQAAAAVDRCDAASADKLIEATKTSLLKVPCAAHPKYGAVQKALQQLEEKLVVRAMDAGGSNDCRKNDDEKDLVLITIAGGGFIPHWAGGSYKSNGKKTSLGRLADGETTGDRVAQIYDDLLNSACEAQLPRGILNYATPDIWQTLQVSAKRVTREQADAAQRDSTFKKDDGENYGLSDIRGKICSK